MSQAFVKEGDASDDLPERPLSGRPNYVTRAGHDELKRKRDELGERRSKLVARRGQGTDDELKLVERDLRYFEARLGSAILVQRPGAPPQDILFGAQVEVRDASGVHRYVIVGEDEADPAQGKLSWASPLALALMGGKPGDEVSWESPEGPARLSIVSVSYP